MQEYILKIDFKSDTLIGSGEGFGKLIDTDIVFDDLGLPYIPAKRIKGCLRDSAEEIVNFYNSIFKDNENIIDILFGTSTNKGLIYFENLYIADEDEYKKTRLCLEYLLSKTQTQGAFSRERITSSFTSVRKQTSIDNRGIAKEGSLRASRVINSGETFSGKITIQDDKYHEFLSVAVMNFKYIGTMRNRGFGNIRCMLLDKNKKDISQTTIENMEKILNV